MIKGNGSDESHGGNVFTKVISFFSMCRKNKNSQSQPHRIPTERSISQNENQKMSQVLFETYSIFYNAGKSRSPPVTLKAKEQK